VSDSFVFPISEAIGFLSNYWPWRQSLTLMLAPKSLGFQVLHRGSPTFGNNEIINHLLGVTIFTILHVLVGSFTLEVGVGNEKVMRSAQFQ